jgi:hypothetical protein
MRYTSRKLFQTVQWGVVFYGRTIIVFSDKKANVNALVDRPQGLLPWDTLVTPLKTIARARGPFEWAEDAKDHYREWYNWFQEQDNDDTTGVLERLHDHVLKTAMLISLSREPNLRLELEDIQEAIKACQDFIPGSKRVALGQIGKSISAPGTSVLLRELLSNEEHSITRSEALRRHWQHFDAFELDRIAESLEAQHAISIKPDRSSGSLEVRYVLNPVVLERYKEREQKEKGKE